MLHILSSSPCQSATPAGTAALRNMTLRLARTRLRECSCPSARLRSQRDDRAGSHTDSVLRKARAPDSCRRQAMHNRDSYTSNLQTRNFWLCIRKSSSKKISLREEALNKDE